MTSEEFSELVGKTVQELPVEFASKLDNVDVVVEDWPTAADLRSIKAGPNTLLFGLYRGVPHTKRGSNYSGVLPDKIVIFMGPIMMVSHSPQELVAKVKEVVHHEIGHYFGLSDAQIQMALK